jgi:uncharacterized protein YodC (DUF2158 family)
MMSFEPGDVVIAKSGRPRMTVEGYEDGYVVCFWFDGKTRHSGTFKEATLATYSTPSASVISRETSWIKARRGK